MLTGEREERRGEREGGREREMRKGTGKGMEEEGNKN